jgi:hypothetical protein
MHERNNKSIHNFSWKSHGKGSLRKFEARLEFTEIKVKLSLFLTKHHAMKEYWGSGGIAPLIL